MHAEANARIECPLGKLDPLSTPYAIADGIVAYGLGLGITTFSGSVTRLPKMTEVNRRAPSLFRPTMKRSTERAKTGSVEPRRVKMLKTHPKYWLARSLLTNRNVRVSQIEITCGKKSTTV